MPGLAREPIVSGYAELVSLYPDEFTVHALLNPGIVNSIVRVHNLEITNHAGGSWSRFSITNRQGETGRFELRVVRFALIKGSADKTEEQPVVRMGICLGNLYKIIEVHLADQEGLGPAVILGRSFMQSDVLVDSGKRFVTVPGCDTPQIKMKR